QHQYLRLVDAAPLKLRFPLQRPAWQRERLQTGRVATATIRFVVHHALHQNTGRGSIRWYWAKMVGSACVRRQINLRELEDDAAFQLGPATRQYRKDAYHRRSWSTGRF